tara:strand:- start:174 stop:761 length:588 start_codon:yes stop_codon:yes gene_type:complete
MRTADVQVIDDLGLDIEGLRRSALEADYQLVSVDVPGVDYDAELMAPAPNKLSRQVIMAAGSRLNKHVRMVSSAYRLCEAATGDGWRIAGGGPKGVHLADHVAVLNLNARSGPYKEDGTGLALWRHDPSGEVSGDAASPLERFSSRSWSMCGLIPLVAGRVVLLPVEAYVSFWPMSPPGTGFDAGRLMWAAYVDG